MTENGNGMVLPVQPMGNYGMNGGFGGMWGSDIWVILIVLFALGGFGGMGWGGFGGFGGGFGNMFEFPWLLNGQNGINNNVNDGFRTSQLQDSVTSVRDGIASLSTQLCGCCGDMQMAMSNGFSGVQTSLCNGFAGVNQTLSNGFANAETAANARQMANMQQNFAAQTATLQGFNGVQSQIAQASADNRLGVANLGSDIAREACATRTADTQNTQSLLMAITNGIQSIKDDLCQDRLDAERRENANLRSELMYARGQASRVDQTAQILANNNAQTAIFQQGLNNEVDALYNRLNNCPVATVPVYGRQPIFTCPNNNGCGCGCNNF